MILHILNIGVLKQLDIDISKDFILFCGPNGTGKTYGSYILYAFLSNTNLFKLIPCFDDISDSLNKTGSFVIDRNYIGKWLNSKCEDVKSQLGSIFGISEETCSKLFGRFSLECEYTDIDFQRTTDYSLDTTWKDDSTAFRIVKKAGENIVRIESSSEIKRSLYPHSLRTISLINELLTVLAFANFGTVRMLTVERNSIYTFKTELSLSRNELIDRIQQHDTNSELDLLSMVNSSSRRYPMAVRSSLRIANDLSNVQKQQSEYAGIALLIEKELLHGEVSTTKDGDVEFHAAGMPKTKRLPFHLSSSIVKTMASLVVYLKHLAHRGDTLIVDEPEMNFHPDVQILLARIFAKLSNNGLRIVISSHSDYIIREINNMIMAGALVEEKKEELVKEIGYERDCTIEKSHVNVIFFNYKSKTVVAKSLPVNDYGFEVITIDEAIVRQNKISEKLYDCLNS